MATLLIVDDSTYNRKLIKKYLINSNFTILEAADGQAALEIITQRPLDCIILDLMMPVMDGFHLLAELQAIDNQTPIVVATADIQHETAQQCLDMGVSQVLHKPIGGDELRNAITHVLGGMV